VLIIRYVICIYAQIIGTQIFKLHHRKAKLAEEYYLAPIDTNKQEN
jgi:hypothetical protein